MRRLITILGLVAIAACKEAPSKPAPVGLVTLSRDTATLVPTVTLQLSATVKDISGNTVSRPVAWSTTDPLRASVSPTGLVTGVGTGVATISATVENTSGSTLVTVKEGAIVGPGGGTVTAIGGEATLVIPANALTSNVMITIEPAGSPPPTPRLVPGTSVDLGPIGQPFALPAQLKLKYSAVQVPVGASEQLLGMQRAASGVWQPVNGSTVDSVAKVVSANLTSLSTYGVLASPIASVTLSADHATLNLGGTLQLVAAALDAANVPVANAPITWGSASPDIVAVSADGLVTALDAGGPVNITASSNGKRATAAITVTASKSVALSVAHLTLAAAVNGPNPAAQQINVTSVGVAALSGLTSTITYHAGQPTGWLAAPLGGTSTPTQLTVQATTGTLPPGQYGADVKVASSDPGAASGRFDVTFTVASPSIVVNAGDMQSAMEGTPVAVPPSVLVRDGLGHPAPNATVTFAVTDGGGSLANAVVNTDAAGIATVGSWTLGPVANPNALTATVTGTGFGAGNNTVSFGATGCHGGGGTGYAITLCFVTNMSPTQRAAFQDAATRWSSLITGDVEDVPAQTAAGACGAGSPSTNMTIDDLLIFARIEPIDGVNGVLGSAGPCFIRSSDSLPIIGTMRFDDADVAALEASGQLRDVILHEMGHVIGIGSLWSFKHLLVSPSTVGGPQLDTHFIGVSAIAGFDAVGGITYTAGLKVPVENQFGAGTINSHWREAVLGNELMTGFLNRGSNPLSVVTVRSLEDLGYTVNAAGADPFQLFLSLQAQTPGENTRRPYGDDVIHGPIYRIDARGRISRVKQ